MRFLKGKRALRVALVYILIASLWIFFSDMLAERLFSNTPFYAQVQLLKGWAFVFVTGILLLVERCISDVRYQTREKQMQGFMDNSLDGFFLTDTQGRITHWNQAMVLMTGLAVEDMKGRSVIDLLQTVLHQKEMHESVGGHIIEVVKNMLMEGKPAWIKEDIQIDLPGARVSYLEEVLFSMPARKGFCIGGVMGDLTMRLEMEQRLKHSLGEKEVLLKEIHHRVKNNLQILSSLFFLQEKTINAQTDAKQVLRESRGRIRAIAMIHEKLYQSPDLASVDFSDYIRALVSGLMSLYNTEGHAVEVVFETEGVRLDIDTAIPAALVLNELLSNSLKHAFPGIGHGLVRIGVQQEDGQVRLWMSNNGRLLPDNFSWENTDTLGARLISTLAGQLNGRLEVSREPETCFTLIFPYHTPGHG